MIPFNLKEYLKNPSRKVVTRNRDTVKIHCTDFVDERYPIIARVEGASASISFTKDGKYEYSRDTKYDLFFAPEKHKGWVNIYRDFGLGVRNCRCIFDSEEEALRNRDSEAIATVKIEWEE